MQNAQESNAHDSHATREDIKMYTRHGRRQYTPLPYFTFLAAAAASARGSPKPSLI